jgi:hypothetical protein
MRKSCPFCDFVGYPINLKIKAHNKHSVTAAAG